MQIHFKKVLNDLGVDKYQVSKALKIKDNLALDLIMYDNTCHQLSVADIRKVRRIFSIKSVHLIEDERTGAMTWKEIRRLLDGRSVRLLRTLNRFDWLKLRDLDFGEYPLRFLESVCDDLDLNFRKLVFR